MNTVALHKDIRSHSGIPFALEVAEVAACLEELFEIGCCHYYMIVYFLWLINPAVEAGK